MREWSEHFRREIPTKVLPMKIVRRRDQQSKRRTPMFEERNVVSAEHQRVNGIATHTAHERRVSGTEFDAAKDCNG